MDSVKNIRNKVGMDRETMTKIFSLFSTIVISVVFCIMRPTFLSVKNITNILRDMSPTLVMACGVAFALMLGSIDLSTGTVASCAAVLMTVLLQEVGVWAYPIVIIYGVFAGALNGLLHTKLGVPSFIATLSTQAIWQSAAYLLSGGQPLSLLPKAWPLVNWGKVNILGCIPLLFLAALVVLLVYSFISRYTGIGRTVRAVGSNERATWLMGQNVHAAKILAFMCSGLGAAIGGIFFAVKAKSGVPTVGVQYNMLGIAAAVLGGIQMTGGKGSVFMTLLGALLITIIQNGMNVVGVDGLWQQIIFGALLLAAIYMNSDKDHKGLIVK
ncbi:MAG: ABC transporter permease [Eubacteriales bacterium]|nr:ABC transporter permease [Eubacteriales bacterium]